MLDAQNNALSGRRGVISRVPESAITWSRSREVQLGGAYGQ
jgi:hypothetical protein